jgi:diguanylate cyclase (GGDEF)-like protein
MRMSAQLCLVSSLLYACWMAAHLYSVRAGYMAAAVLPLVIGLHAVGMVAFYPLVRCGFASRFRDSGLVQVQILWGAAALMIVYPFNPTLRAAMMETLCLQLMFGLFALRPRKLVFTGAAIIAIQLLMLAGAARLRPLPFNVRDESFKVLYSCVIISLITWISVVRSRDKAKSVDRKRELDAAVAQVDERVRRDSLTGLFNRKHMQGLLDREKARHALTGQAFCVALIDLDHFKRVNDTHGHHVGDEVLLGFARIAQASLRETDTIARWGGEEFLVLLPETASEADGRVSMDRLRARIEASMPSATVPALRVTFSAGLALHEDGLGIERTLERADQALYRAKESGRNRIVTASRSLDSAACSRRGEREPESPGVPAAG